MTGRHRASGAKLNHYRIIEGIQVRMVLQCSWSAHGFCPASVDGFCVGGTADGKCHG